jgi:hypothetical protein
MVSKFGIKQQAEISISDRTRRFYWQDILIIISLAIAAAIVLTYATKQINPVIYQRDNTWFGADIKRVFDNMSDRGGDHYRTKVHPLFSLISFPLVFLLKLAGLETIAAVNTEILIVACLWISALYVLLRLVVICRFDCVLFSILGSIGAAAIFWFTVPETYSFGSLSIIIGLCLAAIIEYRQVAQSWYVGVSALTLSFTTTNWLVGIATTFVSHPWKKALQITVNAFCVVVLLWSVQKVIFKTAVFFLGDREEKRYLFLAGSGGPLQVLKSIVAHTMVMPAINILPNKSQPMGLPLLSTQASTPGSGSIWGLVAVVLWTALLGLGVWGFFSTNKHLKLRLVLGIVLLGQGLVHMVYGDETFLYALHFLPSLLLLAAFSLLTPARLVALGLAGALIVCAGINNGLQFKQATDILYDHAPNRYQVIEQMQNRPADLWSRDTGHAILAAPGSREVDKAYHEPGGSFSPSVGSFGVSLWLMDDRGNIQATSDNLPLSDIEQQLSLTKGQDIPGILTKTKDYQAQWVSQTLGKSWTLNLQPQANRSLKPMVVVRSIGPAGGKIQDLKWDGKQLVINDRWVITSNPTPLAVHLGEEGSKDWKTERLGLTQWQGKNGWGYARFELAEASKWSIDITDRKYAPPQATITNTPSVLQLNLGDRRFAESLNAQVAHIKMGIVNRETRPGDPTNYPLTWQRDGAYQLVALARAGQLAAAKELSTYFAENDFFGGFGPEADAPGLSIWALEQVAQLQRVTKSNEDAATNLDYDRLVWPHIRRKAEFILKMLSTTKPIERSVDSVITPTAQEDPDIHLVAEPSRNGLIIGRMDRHRPILFVNAVSYRGLLDAADWAERLNYTAEATLWRTKATQLQKAWEKAFRPPESDNDRTYISSLWPSWIATGRKDELLQRLQARWDRQRDPQGEFRTAPLWTYFTLAEAHQWLFLNRPEQVWTTLQWFWQHQASPGLYTWWEGDGEENTFKLWENVRGWVKPPYVTPHYWTAAEMLLLQLDMLAYTDLAAREPTVVIGAGIPQQWLNKPMEIKGLSMPNGQIDWQWNSGKVNVKVRGSKVKVKLGASFPANAPLEVEYL